MAVHSLKRAGMAAGVLFASAVLPVASALPAAAATNDSFVVYTGESPGCAEYGGAQFVDHGDVFGDDYVGVFDTCRDGVGVKAWVWINGRLIGAQRNGSGGEVYFDIPNVKAKDSVGIKVCAQNGPNGTPFACGSRTRKSVDG